MRLVNPTFRAPLPTLMYGLKIEDKYEDDDNNKYSSGEDIFTQVESVVTDTHDIKVFSPVLI